MAEKLASLKKVGGGGVVDIFEYDTLVGANDYVVRATTNTINGYTPVAGDMIIIPIRGNPTISNVQGAKQYTKSTPSGSFALGWSTLIVESDGTAFSFVSSNQYSGYFWILRKS